MAFKSQEVEGDDKESPSPISREKTESKLQAGASASRENPKMTNLHKTLLKYTFTLTQSLDSSYRRGHIFR